MARTMTRRALLAAAAATGGFLLTKRFWPATHASPADGFDVAGWGQSWVTPLWERIGRSEGERVLALPRGSRGTAPDQPIPVFLLDHDFMTGEMELAFRVSGSSLRPGVLFGATAPFDFAAVTIEEGRLVLAEYSREQRHVVATAPATSLAAGQDFTLRVALGRTSARASIWSAAGEPSDPQLSASYRARRGAPGVLAVQPLDRAPSELRVSAFDVRPADGVAETPMVTPVVMTGTPTPGQDGSYSARVAVWSAWPASVAFERSTSDEFTSAETFGEATTDAPPYVAHALLETEGPRPAYWRARVRGRENEQEHVTPVHALHPPAADRRLVLLGASCVQLVGPPPNEGFKRLLRAAPEAPALLVFQGDLGYANNVANAAYAVEADFFADRFQRTLARPDFAALRRTTPVGFTLDDHDYGHNNADRKTVQPWAVDLWNRIHADPSREGFFETRFGDVHCLALDVRRHADSVREADGPGKTRLGQAQFDWMETVLRESDAGLFVLFSGGTFARRWDPVRNRRVMDTFIYGWPDEYRRAMALYGEVQARGKRVLIVSGDAHGLRVHLHPDPLSGLERRGEPVVELICSGLRTAVWSVAPPDDPTVDRVRNVTGRPGAGMIVVDPVGAKKRRVVLRGIGTGPSDPLDLFPPLVLPFAAR
jgi:hypothetical protein